MTHVNKTKILTIDDEPIILEVLTSYLKDAGHDVVCANDGKEGLELFNKEYFDLVLTDLYMPEIGGLDVLKSITEQSPDIPIIIVSGAGNLQDSINALRLGAWDYITKPVEYNFFLHQVSKAIEQSQLRRENKQYRYNLEEQIKQRTQDLNKRSKELQETNLQLEAEIKEKEISQYKLKKAANLWQTTFDSMTEFISIHDPQNIILQINKPLADFLNQKPDQIIGKKCCDIYQCSFQKKDCPHQQALNFGKDHTTEHENSNFGIPLLITTSPIINDGHLIGSVHITKDISQQKKLAEERQKTLNLESIAGLAGGLSHDFNNLLTAMTGYIDIARLEADPNSNIFDMLSNAKMVSQLASDLTTQLVSFSEGGAPIFKPIFLSDIIKNSLSMMFCECKDIQLKTDLAEDLWLIDGDTTQLKILIKNVLYNASESMPDGGTLSITSKNVIPEDTEHHDLSGNQILLQISDEGRGISKSNLQKIFDPYFTTKEKDSIKGKGLGLSICYSIAKKHQGRIFVTSEENRGTIFSLYLPALI